MSAVIEIEGLRKTFHSMRNGRRVAVDGFDLLVEAGQVHGFLGPTVPARPPPCVPCSGWYAPTAAG